jgi:hypothetical protein
MSAEIDEFRKNLVAAVQAELERHASAVVAEVDRLREEGQRDRDELRAQVETLTKEVRDGSAASKQLKIIEDRLVESEQRLTRRMDDTAAGVEGMVGEAVRPTINDLKDENAGLVRRVEALDADLRKFDEQAARMVTYFNDVSKRIEERQEESSATLQEEITSQMGELKRLVEENDSAIRRFQNEVGQSVSQKLNDAEDRFNSRLLAAESRIQEDAGQKIAEIDAHVGRVSGGLDDTMAVLNERIAGLDDRFVEMGRRIDEVKESVKDIDAEALDALKAQMSSAAGEAMLVRIEMERLEKNLNERSDELVVRVGEVETQLADATMDVSTAIQLDRLEEIERSLAELDPDKFVLKDGSEAVSGTGGPTLPAPSGAPSGGSSPPDLDESVKNSDPGADGHPGIDIAAIIARAEGDRHGDSNH